MNDDSHPAQSSASRISRPYRLMLGGTVLLLLATLTAVALLILLANAQEERQESDFTATLTALAPSMYFAQSDLVPSPEPGAMLVPGQFPFALGTESLSPAPGDSCAEQVVTGSILDNSGQPTDAFSVLVWGDFVSPRLLLTGEIAGLETGQWRLVVPGDINRRVWVQMTAAGRYLSAPVEIVFSAGDCDHSQVSLIFEQRDALSSAPSS